MDVLDPCCCGLDVHKKTVVACLLQTGADGQHRREVRTFATMTDDLLALADWLTAVGCTHVAMESTGVYGTTRARASVGAAGPARAAGGCGALIEAACGAVRTKQAGRTALAGHYRRLVARRGRQKAIVAVGHRLVLIISHVLRDGQFSQESTPTDLDHRRRRRARDRAIAHLRHLGYDVTVTPLLAAA